MEQKEVYDCGYTKHGVILVLLCINYCIVFHTNNCKPTFVPPCICEIILKGTKQLKMTCLIPFLLFFGLRMAIHFGMVLCELPPSAHAPSGGEGCRGEEAGPQLGQ